MTSKSYNIMSGPHLSCFVYASSFQPSLWVHTRVGSSTIAVEAQLFTDPMMIEMCYQKSHWHRVCEHPHSIFGISNVQPELRCHQEAQIVSFFLVLATCSWMETAVYPDRCLLVEVGIPPRRAPGRRKNASPREHPGNRTPTHIS